MIYINENEIIITAKWKFLLNCCSECIECNYTLHEMIVFCNIFKYHYLIFIYKFIKGVLRVCSEEYKINVRIVFSPPYSSFMNIYE